MFAAFPGLDTRGLLGFAFAVLLLAVFVKGVIGRGLPTISVGLLGLVLAPLEAAALLLVPNLVTNFWQLLVGPDLRAIMRRLWPMLAGIVAGTLLAAAWFPLGGAASFPPGGVARFPPGGVAWATPLLGAALALYAGFGLFALQLGVAARHEAWAGPLVGAATGAVTILTGVFVLPAVPYLQALRLQKDDLVQALGLSFQISTLALAAALLWQGEFRMPQAGASLLALLPALGGMLLGQVLRARISAQVFRRCFFGGLLLLGCYLMLKALL